MPAFKVKNGDNGTPSRPKEAYAEIRSTGVKHKLHTIICKTKDISKVVWRGVSTIVFNANGGSGSMANQEVIPDTPTALNANTFTRDKHNFLGWGESSTGSVKYTDKQTITLTESGITKTLYALWKKLTAFVRFDANGGSGSMADQEIELNTPTAISDVAFQKAKCNFIGWAETKNGTIRYSNRQSITLTQSGQVKMLYAAWKHTHDSSCYYDPPCTWEDRTCDVCGEAYQYITYHCKYCGDCSGNEVGNESSCSCGNVRQDNAHPAEHLECGLSDTYPPT